MTEVQHEMPSVLPSSAEADVLEQDRATIAEAPTGLADLADRGGVPLADASEFDLVDQAIEVPLDEDDDR